MIAFSNFKLVIGKLWLAILSIDQINLKERNRINIALYFQSELESVNKIVLVEKRSLNEAFLKPESKLKVSKQLKLFELAELMVSKLASRKSYTFIGLILDIQEESR